MRSQFSAQLFVGAAGLVLALLPVACSGAREANAPRPVLRQPTPTSVTKDEPGGDSSHPEIAALLRLEQEGWGRREDRYGALAVPLSDGKNWRRVKFWLVPTYTGFRYGDDHHAVASVFVRDAPAPSADAEACLVDFEKWARGLLERFGANVGESREQEVKWHGTSLRVRLREGMVAWGWEKKRYAGAYAAYTPWPNTCVILGYGVPMNEHPELALRVRDRFAREAFGRFVPLAKQRP